MKLPEALWGCVYVNVCVSLCVCGCVWIVVCVWMCVCLNLHCTLCEPGMAM